ncbi:unnamed protein product, partial [Rotaria magnacalcarata]
LITIRTANTNINNSSFTNGSAQLQSNRLQNSTSSNSLFGPPHHLGTLNDSNHDMINIPAYTTLNSASPNKINPTPPPTVT